MTRHANDKQLLVVVVESTGAQHSTVHYKRGIAAIEQAHDTQWDCAQYFDDPTGVRLVEEIIRRSRVHIADSGQQPDAIAITLPGSIEDASRVARSTRLGILQPVDISKIFDERGMPRCLVLHDVECMALGEARHGALRQVQGISSGHESFTFVFADEGIASTHYIDGKFYRGAGSAGRIGRLVVLPDGSYSRTFRSRGPLEMYAARPWVSTNIVGELLAEQDKTGEPTTGDRAFRTTVSTVAQGDWSRLTFKQIAQGISTNDPVAVTVIEEAARFLGMAIHSIIIVAHPPAIVLGGGMITELPGFSQSVISHARRFTYDVAWNRTAILPAALGREAQILGAAEVAAQILA
jgi:glucokinase